MKLRGTASLILFVRAGPHSVRVILGQGDRDGLAHPTSSTVWDAMASLKMVARGDCVHVRRRVQGQSGLAIRRHDIGGRAAVRPRLEHEMNSDHVTHGGSRVHPVPHCCLYAFKAVTTACAASAAALAFSGWLCDVAVPLRSKRACDWLGDGLQGWRGLRCSERQG
jgi:hypothetical protein